MFIPEGAKHWFILHYNHLRDTDYGSLYAALKKSGFSYYHILVRTELVQA